MSSLFSISGSNISYEFPNGALLFSGLCFSFGSQTYGLIGSNGIGKTTLMKMLSGDLESTHGTLSFKGNRALMPQILHWSDMKSEPKTVEEILGVQNISHAL